MFLIIALLRVALSAIFGVAGITKLIDQRRTREAVQNFGAPEALAPAIAIILPLAELSIAVGLLFGTTMRWSAAGGLALLSLFFIAISINLALGRTHDCHCFGQLHSRPLGWRTLVRNIVFGAAAGFVLWGSGEAIPDIVPTLSEAVARLTPLQTLLLIFGVFVTAGAVVHYQRRQRRSAEAAARLYRGLPVGTLAPPFELGAYEGGTMSLAQLLAHGKPLLLIFTNPNCRPCLAIFKEIKKWQEVHNQHLTIAIITVGTIKDNFVNVAKNRLGQVLLQKEREVGEQYHATATPSAVIVNTNSQIASHVAGGADEISELLKTIVGDSNDPLEHEHLRPGPVEQLQTEVDSPV